jgi:hypothetical protein
MIAPEGRVLSEVYRGMGEASKQFGARNLDHGVTKVREGMKRETRPQTSSHSS